MMTMNGMRKIRLVKNIVVALLAICFNNHLKYTPKQRDHHTLDVP